MLQQELSVDVAAFKEKYSGLSQESIGMRELLNWLEVVVQAQESPQTQHLILLTGAFLLLQSDNLASDRLIQDLNLVLGQDILVLCTQYWPQYINN